MTTEYDIQVEDYRFTHHSTIRMTEAMWLRLQQVVADRRDPKFTTTDAVREAIRLYLDNSEDLIGSRKHFGKSLQRSLTLHEHTMLFTLHAILLMLARMFAYLVKNRDGRDVDPMLIIESAIIESKKLSNRLIEGVNAVRSNKSIQPE